MSLASKNKIHWRPSAGIDLLKVRATFLQQIRDFFHARHAYEVDTPVLYSGVATDPFLQAFAVDCGDKTSRYLQTSPEFPMKRLIAAGSGDIYYLGKAFRKQETGRKHNPEFTILEWYRVNWDHWQLIKEVDELLQALLNTKPANLVTYADLFAEYFGINPHLATVEQLQIIAVNKGWISENQRLDLDRDGWLDLLLTHGIEPNLGWEIPQVITDYPASQASLAKLRRIKGPVSYQVAERFEFYMNGIELANGYHELACAEEQEQRFMVDIQKRKEEGLPSCPLDEALLAALAELPPCAGVAIGVDRLLMLATHSEEIQQILSFSWDNA